MAPYTRPMRTVLVGERPAAIASWLHMRRRRGLDIFDEIWQGDYHVAPAPQLRHAWIDGQAARCLDPRASAAGLAPCGPLNIGGPDDYRVPDRAYLRRFTPEVYVPSASIVVEIASPGDETYEKLDFYFRRGVEELLVLDGQPGAVEWYRGEHGFERVTRSNLLGVTEDELGAEIDWPPAD